MKHHLTFPKGNVTEDSRMLTEERFFQGGFSGVYLVAQFLVVREGFDEVEHHAFFAIASRTD
jgi:hypothetical protein